MALSDFKWKIILSFLHISYFRSWKCRRMRPLSVKSETFQKVCLSYIPFINFIKLEMNIIVQVTSFKISFKCSHLFFQQHQSRKCLLFIHTCICISYWNVILTSEDYYPHRWPRLHVCPIVVATISSTFLWHQRMRRMLLVKQDLLTPQYHLSSQKWKKTIRSDSWHSGLVFYASSVLWTFYIVVLCFLPWHFQYFSTSVLFALVLYLQSLHMRRLYTK